MNATVALLYINKMNRPGNEAMEVNVTVTLHGLQGYFIARLNATEIELGLVMRQ